MKWLHFKFTLPPPTELASELRWPEHPNVHTSLSWLARLNFIWFISTVIIHFYNAFMRSILSIYH